MRLLLVLVGALTLGVQAIEEKDVPLMSAAEEAIVEQQNQFFLEAAASVLTDAAKSTVRIWGVNRRINEGELLAFGVVVGDGSKVLTKWSQIDGSLDSMIVQSGDRQAFQAEVVGVYTEDDLAVLQLSSLEVDAPKVSLPVANFFEKDLDHGTFLLAVNPDAKLAAFGVVGVLERNLRDTDRAHLGIMVDQAYRGQGVRIKGVQPEYGAAEAGIQAGDVILAISDREVGDLVELQSALVNLAPGDEVQVKFLTGGNEKMVSVMLANRPLIGQFRGNRINQMEQMGGETNRVRSGFAEVVQSDMRLRQNEVGGPVVDLDGNVIGITAARGGRTKTYMISSQALGKILDGEVDTVSIARSKAVARRHELRKQQQAMAPRMRPNGKARSYGQVKRHSSDLGRLLKLLRGELGELEFEPRRR